MVLGPDESRIVCGQVLAIESAIGQHKYAPHTVLSVSDRLYQTGSMNHQAVTAVNKMPTDNSIFWIVKEAHGQKRCEPGDETYYCARLKLHFAVRDAYTMQPDDPFDKFNHWTESSCKLGRCSAQEARSVSPWSQRSWRRRLQPRSSVTI